MFDVFNEPGRPPTDEVLAKQFESLRGLMPAEQISQSDELAIN
jgi:hypothetical protein